MKRSSVTSRPSPPAGVGLNRTEAGQAYPALWRWNLLLELASYSAGGFRRQASTRGHEASDVVNLARLHTYYVRVVEAREGVSWPSSQAIRELTGALRKTPLPNLSTKIIESSTFRISTNPRCKSA